MRLGKFMLAAAAASMAVAPAMAAPVNPASSLSVASSVRTGSDSVDDSKVRGKSVIIALLAVVVVVVGIVIVVRDHDDTPDSP